jgi:hypothetical protein
VPVGDFDGVDPLSAFDYPSGSESGEGYRGDRYRLPAQFLGKPPHTRFLPRWAWV